MGLFSKHKSKLSMRDFAQQKKSDLEENDAKVLNQTMNRWKILQEAEQPPMMVVPDFNLDGFPFGNRAYCSKGIMSLNETTGEVFEDYRFFYADSDACENISADISRLEKLIDGDKIGIPNLPELRTDARRFHSVSKPAEATDDNTVRMTLKPFTPTGKNAKYPITVNFSSYSDPSMSGNGSHGELDYMKDGSIGKAVIYYWNDHIFYGVHFKLVDGFIQIGRIDYSDNPSENKIAIYSI